MGRPRRLLSCLVALALAGLVAPLVGAGPASSQAETARLVNIRAGRHIDPFVFDRIVFDFFGPLPTSTSVRYVTRVIADPSGATVPMRGNAFLQVTMQGAHGHDPETGALTYPDRRPAFDVANIVHAVNSGDFEDVLSFGIAVLRRAPVHVFTLTDPNRVVIDVDAPFTNRSVRDFFLDRFRFEANTPPFARSVGRTVPSSSVAVTVARDTLFRFFAHPTGAEKAQGLQLVVSGATGFADLSISTGRVARVRLTGGCTSRGSTFTIADEIMPTLRQFASVDWVKIYDPAGTTEFPTGQRDSIPTCLEP